MGVPRGCPPKTHVPLLCPVPDDFSTFGCRLPAASRPFGFRLPGRFAHSAIPFPPSGMADGCTQKTARMADGSLHLWGITGGKMGTTMTPGRLSTKSRGFPPIRPSHSRLCDGGWQHPQSSRMVVGSTQKTAGMADSSLHSRGITREKMGTTTTQRSLKSLYTLQPTSL